MVHLSSETTQSEVPRGNEHPTHPSIDLKQVNCKRGHPARMTTLADDFDQLQSSLSDLETLISTVDKDISALLEVVTSSDEIYNSAVIISKTLFEVESRVAYYRELSSSLQSRMTNSKDGPVGITMNLVSIFQLITKLEGQLKWTKTSTLEQLRFKSRLVTSTVPSTPVVPSTNDCSHSIIVSPTSSVTHSSTDSIESIKENVTSLESQPSSRSESHPPSKAKPSADIHDEPITMTSNIDDDSNNDPLSTHIEVHPHLVQQAIEISTCPMPSGLAPVQTDTVSHIDYDIVNSSTSISSNQNDDHSKTIMTNDCRSSTKLAPISISGTSPKKKPPQGDLLSQGDLPLLHGNQHLSLIGLIHVPLATHGWTIPVTGHPWPISSSHGPPLACLFYDCPALVGLVY